MHAKKFVKTAPLKSVLTLLLLSLILGGCSSFSLFGKRDLPQASPEGLYATAAEEYKDGNYKKAREYFSRVKEEYPLHELSVLAEIGIADSLYSNKDYEEAKDAYSDFISLHPINENVPYAVYQTGMCHYHRMEAIDRDQTETINARKEWEKLIARYPESKFSIMAEKMLKEVKQRLAEREFYIGNFYLNHKKYKAALARFEKIAAEYSNVGLDYKIENYIKEAKTGVDEEEKEKLREDEAQKSKEQDTIKKEEEKKKIAEEKRLKEEEAKRVKEEARIKKEEEKKRKVEEKRLQEEEAKRVKEEARIKKEEEKKKKAEEKRLREEEAKRVKEEARIKKEEEKKRKAEEKRLKEEEEKRLKEQAKMKN
ncbi:MAG TPA: outer membrane protein assembly factor BamD [Smithella sp.]|nr:outer membrane protein assembly factor BamD [Smithella sp.]